MKFLSFDGLVKTYIIVHFMVLKDEGRPLQHSLSNI